jgi:hypothetical protein
MNYKVYLTETFQKSIKILKKKYRRVKDDIAGTIQAIEKIQPLGTLSLAGTKRFGKQELQVPMLRRELAVAFGQFTSGNQKKGLFIC